GRFEVEPRPAEVAAQLDQARVHQMHDSRDGLGFGLGVFGHSLEEFRQRAPGYHRPDLLLRSLSKFGAKVLRSGPRSLVGGLSQRICGGSRPLPRGRAGPVRGPVRTAGHLDGESDTMSSVEAWWTAAAALLHRSRARSRGAVADLITDGDG